MVIDSRKIPQHQGQGSDFELVVSGVYKDEIIGKFTTTRKQYDVNLCYANDGSSYYIPKDFDIKAGEPTTDVYLYNQEKATVPTRLLDPKIQEYYLQFSSVNGYDEVLNVSEVTILEFIPNSSYVPSE